MRQLVATRHRIAVGFDRLPQQVEERRGLRIGQIKLHYRPNPFRFSMIVQTVRGDSEVADLGRGYRRRSASSMLTSRATVMARNIWPNNRLQIGEAPRERIDWHDVPITGGRQRGEAEIQHDTA